MSAFAIAFVFRFAFAFVFGSVSVFLIVLVLLSVFIFVFVFVLATVATNVGCERINVAATKTILRNRGTARQRLAARVSKLSKARNVQAHPDVALVNNITDVLSMEPMEGVGTSVCETSEFKK